MEKTTIAAVERWLDKRKHNSLMHSGWKKVDENRRYAVCIELGKGQRTRTLLSVGCMLPSMVSKRCPHLVPASVPFLAFKREIIEGSVEEEAKRESV